MLSVQDFLIPMAVMEVRLLLLMLMIKSTSHLPRVHRAIRGSEGEAATHNGHKAHGLVDEVVRPLEEEVAQAIIAQGVGDGELPVVHTVK